MTYLKLNRADCIFATRITMANYTSQAIHVAVKNCDINCHI